MASEKRLIYANEADPRSIAYPVFPGCRQYNQYEEGFNDAVIACYGLLTNALTVDAVEVVHGRWEKCWQEKSKHYFRCSNCHTAYMDGVTGAIAPEYGSRAWRYCPNCGAKMDGGADDGT